MNEPSERELVEGAARGDSAAVAEIYRRYWKASRAAAYGVTADLASAEDAAAEGLIAALASLHKLRNPECLGPWLRCIVVRAARRQRPRHASWADLNAVSVEASFPARLEQREFALLVREAVDRLSGPLREAISLHYFEGYPITEGARFLGIPVGTFKRRLHEGRRRLKDTCSAIVQGRRPMNTDRARLAERIDGLLAEGADPNRFFELVKEAMQLRPFPHDLMHRLVKGQLGTQLVGEQWEKTRSAAIDALRQYARPSARTADPNHPVGRAFHAICEALPHFQRWDVTPEEVVQQIADRYGPDSPSEPQFVLPPGFAEGCSSASLRLTRGLVIVDDQGDLKDLGALLREDAAPETMKRRMERDARVSDVMDLNWMETRPLELREVELTLRELAKSVIPTASVHFSADTQLRYRTALRMHLGEGPTPAATGGVLEHWPGMPDGTGAAHVRLFLEVWAAVMSGSPVGFCEFPHFACPSTEEREPPH